MLDRFQGQQGRRLLTEAIFTQSVVLGNDALAMELADRIELIEVAAGQAIIEQNAEDNDIYFIISGVFDIIINGRLVQKRGPSHHVGEMAAIQPTQKRSATVIATESAVVGKLSESAFSEIAERYPQLYRRIAQELSRRLLERNALINEYREKIRVFIISSSEALPVARIVQDSFEHDPYRTIVWPDGVFRATSYTLQNLEREIDDSDFAVAIAHSDDLTQSRGANWPSPRDNVIFELGLFMGRLGRARAILMEPREEKVKLPSDLSGITTVTYRYEKGADAVALMAPACNALRNHINSLGPFNG